MKQTLVIGSTVVDVIVNIPKLPKTGEDVHISKQSRSLGGCAFLASDILRHFQVPYSLCTAVGGGIYGDYVYTHLKKRGVPIYIHRPESENGCCYCMVEADGERTFIVDHGIEYTFYESYLETIDTDSIDSVYICGLEIEEYTGGEIVNYLEKHPDYTIYFASGPRIMELPQDLVARIFAMHPILHLNEDEIMAYTHTTSHEAGAKALFALTQNTVVVTLGEKGSYCYDGTNEIFVPSKPVANVVDTIGAGDSHIGAIMACRRLDMDWKKALTIANEVSAAVVATEGGLLEKLPVEVSKT
ncbi:carbohydrate kinase family protein [Chakrabartyella piscis]|uniref:carbohydrate kinase family protein n=1 Tax=Chakrabartyella piscis TaxID=2918914 RepID=UPI002958B10D|nr:PfkB family carbohydrate kinase [Chakrabartyella piscis]